MSKSGFFILSFLLLVELLDGIEDERLHESEVLATLLQLFDRLIL